MKTQFWNYLPKTAFIFMLLLSPLISNAETCQELCKEVAKLKKEVVKKEKDFEKKKKSFEDATKEMADAQKALDDFDNDPDAHGPDVKQQRKRLENKLNSAKKKYNKAKAAYYKSAKELKKAIEDLLAKLKQKKEVCTEEGELEEANQAGRDIDSFGERLKEVCAIIDEIINSEIGGDKENVEENIGKRDDESDLAYRQRLRDLIDDLLKRIKEIEEKFGKDTDLAKDLIEILKGFIKEINDVIDQNSDESSVPEDGATDFAVGIFHGFLKSNLRLMQDPGSNTSEDHLPTTSKSYNLGRQSSRHTGLSFAHRITDKIELAASFGYSTARATEQIQMSKPGEDGSTYVFNADVNANQSAYHLGVTANYLFCRGSFSPYASVWIRGGSVRESSSTTFSDHILSIDTLKYNVWNAGPALGVRSALSRNLELDVKFETDLQAQIGAFVGLNWKF